MTGENKIVEQEEEFDVEEVDIEEYAKRGEKPPRAKRYLIRVDKERIPVSIPKITGKEILALVKKTPDKHKLYQHIRGQQPILIGPDQIVDLSKEGVERFTTMPNDTTEGTAINGTAS